MVGAAKNTLRRIGLKDLEPDLDNILIVALIIGKQSPRKFADNKNQDQMRAVWSFTLRDSQRDYINVTYWGPSDEVCIASERFYTGDVVEISNPRVNVRTFDDPSEQFTPEVTSPFFLTLTEHSSILQHKGNVLNFIELLKFPTKSLSGHVPLRDIQNGGESMKERSVDILGAVKFIGPLKDIKTKTGKELQLREVMIFDQTSSSMRVSLWDNEAIARAGKWKPRQTTLFITDARVTWSEYLKSFSASVTGRSIITENPIGKEAAILADYAKNAPLNSGDILDQFITDLPDPDTIQNVLCVKQVKNKINNASGNNTTEPQLTALMFVAITQFDLDGVIPVTRMRCTSCRSYLKNVNPKCESPECPVVIGDKEAEIDHSFDIRMNLSDHTGTLTNCRLARNAEQVLGCTVQQFLRMSNEQKRTLKWKYLMERCAVRIVVLVSSRLPPKISIVSCTRANRLEAAQRIPFC